MLECDFKKREKDKTLNNLVTWWLVKQKFTTMNESLETVIKVVLLGAVDLFIPLSLHSKPVVPAILPASPTPLCEGGERDLCEAGVRLRHELLLVTWLVLPPGL